MSSRTISEPTKVPNEPKGDFDDSLVVIHAQPDEEYVLVQKDIPGVELHSRGVPFYRARGCKRVPVVATEDQDVVLRYPDGTEVPVHPSQIVMKRPKEVAERERVEQNRQNNPKYVDPGDRHLTDLMKTPHGVTTQDREPIRASQMGDALPSRGEINQINAEREARIADPENEAVITLAARRMQERGNSDD